MNSRADTRGFIHKRTGRAIVGGVKGFIGGGIGGAVGGAVGGFVGGGAPAATVCPPGFDPTAGGGCTPRRAKVKGFRGRVQRFLPGGETGFITPPAFGGRRLDTIEPALRAPVVPAPGLVPFFQRIIPGGETGLEVGTVNGAAAVQTPGVATLGRFGAAVEPTFRSSTIRDCPRGMVLAVDSLCYSRRDVRNSERFWPRGRRPLLTGGEVRAISTAASAARKLERKQKELMKLGLLKKPAARRAAPRVEGHRATLEHT